MLKKSLVLFSIAAVSLLAADKNMQTSNTQKKYERKAILGVDIGLPYRDFNVVKAICGEKRCNPVGYINYSITQEVEDKISKELYDWLITQRFDKVIVTPDKAIILTANEKKEIEINGNNNYFRFNTGPLEEFKTKLEKYLDKLSLKMDKLLKASLKERYNELPEKEQETFIKIKAKELGLTPEVVKKLLSSAYVFGVYFIPQKGKITQSEGKKYYSGANVKITPLKNSKLYQVSADIPVKATLLIYKYNPQKKKFISYNSFSGKSGKGSGEDKIFNNKPSNEEIKNLLDESITNDSARAAAVSLSTTLNEDDNFVIFTTADKVEGKKVEAKIGVLEDLRVDAPYEIRRNINGKTKILGFVKARDVVINCKKPGYSKFDLIKGEVELKDQLREHPWTGAFVNLQAGMETYKVTKFNGLSAVGGGIIPTVKLGAALDLGYTTNKKALSEVWFDAFVGFGSGGDKFKAGIYEGKTPLYITAGAGLFKRFYLLNSIYVAPGANINYQLLSSSDRINNDISYSIGSLSAGLKVNAGYNISPDLEIVGSLGYNHILNTSGKIDSTSVDAEAEAGINFFIGVQYHIKTIGPLVKFYKKPSTICKK